MTCGQWTQERVVSSTQTGPHLTSGSDEKPTAVVSTGVEFDTVTILPQTPQLIALLS